MTFSQESTKLVGAPAFACFQSSYLQRHTRITTLITRNHSKNLNYRMQTIQFNAYLHWQCTPLRISSHKPQLLCLISSCSSVVLLNLSPLIRISGVYQMAQWIIRLFGAVFGPSVVWQIRVWLLWLMWRHLMSNSQEEAAYDWKVTCT